MAKHRTMSICLSDIPKDKILKHSNGKLYVSIATYDLDAPDRYNNDFSVSVSLSKEELERKQNGETINRTYVGNGKIWKENIQPASDQDLEGITF